MVERESMTAGRYWRQAIGAALVLVHAVLGLWALVGLAELVIDAPWPPLSNPELPPWLLAIHFTAMLATAALFVAGYATRARATPTAVLAAYGVLATICFVETFFFLTNELRFASMAIEYATYAAILWLLFRTLRERFLHTRTE
jgi:hypothetical protein